MSKIMREWHFACGALAKPGERLTHPDYPGLVLILDNVGGYDGSWSTCFSVEIGGQYHHAGSCMGCEKYTREGFVKSRLEFWMPRPEPEEPAPEEPRYAEVDW